MADTKTVFRDSMAVAEGIAVQLNDASFVAHPQHTHKERWLIAMSSYGDAHMDYNSFMNTFDGREVLTVEERWENDSDVEYELSVVKHDTRFFCLKWYNEGPPENELAVPDEKLVEVADLARTAINLRRSFGVYDITTRQILIKPEVFWMLYSDKLKNGICTHREPSKEDGSLFTTFPGSEENITIGTWLSAKEIETKEEDVK